MKDLSTINSPEDLRQLMVNAKRLNRDDIYWVAFKRLCELEGVGQPDTLHADFHSALRAYEELLSLKNNRSTRASRTRQKLQRHGVVKCLEDWASDTKETQGFKLLVENGLVELTGEFLVLKHHNYFSQKAISSAKKKLKTVEIREELDQFLRDANIKFDIL